MPTVEGSIPAPEVSHLVLQDTSRARAKLLLAGLAVAPGQLLFRASFVVVVLLVCYMVLFGRKRSRSAGRFSRRLRRRVGRNYRAAKRARSRPSLLRSKRRRRSTRRNELIGPKTFMKHRFVQAFNSTVTAGAFTVLKTVQSNAPHDPIGDGSGNGQPRGYDQMAAFYKKYRVRGCKVVALHNCHASAVDAHPDHPLTLGITPSAKGEAPANVRQAVEGKLTKWSQFLPAADTAGTISNVMIPRSQRTLKQKYYVKPSRFFGDQNYFWDDTTAGTSSAVPSHIIPITVWAGTHPGHGGGSDNWSINTTLIVTFYTEWFAREKQALS